ncbi:protein of unknown function [Cyclobacterium xiamenense]|uniref:3-keto-alpha-glucoside-1,2-lyase/3-keto-2-hydroxy-glucal hydratase domain-containing protein n=1 Tax=Cyclobacterium xiamenense TaxID=1297121 RepID=A0A1H7BC52_9BACT|nr:DUF1080 domain-containing protein [Cyclobacterium xiamenense]SEJ71910.1 protein of unknown function [Cyclobacterium xiamenense]
MRTIAKQSGLLLAALVGLVFTAAGQTSLFNGKDLSGWIVYGTEKWYVADGILVSESGPDAEYGYLGTEEDYKDFELTAKFKQDQDGNSGIFFRSTFEGTKVSGWQVEVAPPGNDTGGVYESYGRGWLIKPDAEKDKYLKFGEWNDIKVRVKGDRVVTWLNGKKMVDFSDEKIGQGEGQIALQIHSGGGLKISWKDIEVKEL